MYLARLDPLGVARNCSSCANKDEKREKFFKKRYRDNDVSRPYTLDSQRLGHAQAKFPITPNKRIGLSRMTRSHAPAGVSGARLTLTNWAREARKLVRER